MLYLLTVLLSIKFSFVSMFIIFRNSVSSSPLNFVLITWTQSLYVHSTQTAINFSFIEQSYQMDLLSRVSEGRLPSNSPK